MSTQEEAVAVMLDNGVLEWVRQRPPKGTKLYSQARIDQLEKELAEARKDALMEAHRILSNSQSKPEALGKIDAAMEAK